MPARHNDRQAHRFFEHGTLATGAVTIQRSAADLYAAWRRLSDLPRFVDHLKSVQVIDSTRSRWLATRPGGGDVSWDAEIIRDERNAAIAWKSLKGAKVPNAGTIRFRQLGHDRGTEVKLALEYLPPGRGFVDVLAKPTGNDGQTLVHAALHRFRQVMETGEVPVARPEEARKQSLPAAAPRPALAGMSGIHGVAK